MFRREGGASNKKETVSIDFEQVKKKAQKGDGFAAYFVGYSYSHGLNGVTPDHKEAFNWYKSGTNSVNNALCLFGLGECYEYGLYINEEKTLANYYFIRAFQEIERQAFDSDMYSQCCLGAYYYFGYGSKDKDLRKAVNWYTNSANRGHVDAQFKLGKCFEEGIGVDKDHSKAIRLLASAANQGHIGARAFLQANNGSGKSAASIGTEKQSEKIPVQSDEGVLLNADKGNEESMDAERSPIELVESLRIAAEQGDTDAQADLGECYAFAKGVGKDHKKAAYWYEKAAEQGNARAQYNYGLSYKLGLGVGRDPDKAAYWINKSAEQGYEKA